MGERILTKAHIVQVAIKLFNEAGVQNVSTHHIAAAADISPGNLYYHFKNKEAIVRAILEVMIQDWDAVYQVPTDQSFSIAMLRELERTNFTLLWRYRFFYRELVVLLRHDPELAERYSAIQQQRLAQEVALVEALVAVGAVRAPNEPSELEQIFTSAWVISSFWLSHLEASGLPVTPERVEDGVELIVRLYAPYIQS